MSKRSIRLFVAALLAVFGFALLLRVIPLLGTDVTGTASFLGRVVQAILGIVAAVATATGQRWAPAAIVATGATVAITALVDAFAVGITAPIAGLAVAVLALAIAAVLAWVVA
jgi:hypothetical protein